MDPAAVKYVITSPLSLARVEWWYGEDDLWGAALNLAPATVAELAPRFAELRAAPEVMELIWPGAPSRMRTSCWARSSISKAGRDPRDADTGGADRCRTSST